ncbi:MAG: glycosyltransferase family 2 protein [Candidatus Roizmanbacteria bacterium]
MSITVIIHTCNEEKNIKDCIESARLLTKNIVVIDMESKDRTKEIVNNFQLPIYNFQKSDYVEPAREFGIKQTNTDWVLILDADERITEELTEEIRNVGNDLRVVPNKGEHGGSPLQITYLKIPRQNIFGHTKWLKHGGWWPDYQIRLINKKYFVSWPKRIHSIPKIKGRFEYLKNPIIHYFHGDLEKMVEKTIIFEDIESDLLFKAKKDVNTLIFLRKYFAELWRRMFKSVGFLDGTVGIIESIYQAFSKTITYLFLYEKNYRSHKK